MSCAYLFRAHVQIFTSSLVRDLKQIKHKHLIEVPQRFYNFVDAFTQSLAASLLFAA